MAENCEYLIELDVSSIMSAGQASSSTPEGSSSGASTDSGSSTTATSESDSEPTGKSSGGSNDDSDSGNDEDSEGGGGGGLSTGAKAGIGVGVAVVVIALAAILFFFLRRRKRSQVPLYVPEEEKHGGNSTDLSSSMSPPLERHPYTAAGPFESPTNERPAELSAVPVTELSAGPVGQELVGDDSSRASRARTSDVPGFDHVSPVSGSSPGGYHSPTSLYDNTGPPESAVSPAQFNYPQGDYQSAAYHPDKSMEKQRLQEEMEELRNRKRRMMELDDMESREADLQRRIDQL